MKPPLGCRVMEAIGVIMGYRRGGGRQYNQHVIIKILGVGTKELGKYIGGLVEYKDRYGNIYRGRILRMHGRKNALVIARFKPNLPGQALSDIVKVKPASAK